MWEFIYNILTFGMYRKLETLKSSLKNEVNYLESSLASVHKDISKDIDNRIKNEMESLEMESLLDETIRNNFSPSDFDIVCEGDYPLDEIEYKVTDGDYPLDEIDNKVSEDELIEKVDTILQEEYGLEKK